MYISTDKGCFEQIQNKGEVASFPKPGGLPHPPAGVTSWMVAVPGPFLLLCKSEHPQGACRGEQRGQSWPMPWSCARWLLIG